MEDWNAALSALETENVQIVSSPATGQEVHTLISNHNKKQGKVLCAFTGVIFTSNGISGEGSQYVRHNVQMRALDWKKD